MPRSRPLVLAVLLLALPFGCTTGEKTAESGSPALGTAEIAQHIPADVKDRDGWAADILAAISATKKTPTAERVCAVIAVIEQESRFDPDPPVAGMPHVVRTALLKKLAPLGPLAEPALKVFLAGKAPDSDLSFGQRIDKLRTERDLDRLYRDVAAAYRNGFPGPFAIASGLSRLFANGSVEDLNPITTLGSMQVKVGFAQELEEAHGLGVEDVREYLYTRAGGVRAGTARLLGYDAGYDDILYRFADYNGGVYTSRNAEFQAMLVDLTGQRLALDGDLLAYDRNGEPRSEDSKTLHAMLTFGRMHGSWAWLIRRAAKKEKTAEFEETGIWSDVRSAWEKSKGKKAPYARLPELEVASPKMEHESSTVWFAQSVKRHYTACRARDR